MGKLNVANRTLFTYDNLPVMQGINSETIDLIYLDPPFNSKRNYAAPIGSQAAGAAFKDTWNLDDIKREWVEEIEADNKATWASIISAGHISGESTQAYLTYMAIRLIEMRRILKDTGSIYLHCDSTVSHYLKLVMDAVFCASSFQSEISWKRTSAHNDSKRFGQVKDSIFYYSKTNDRIWNPVYVPHEESYVSNFYRYEDERGKYRLHEIIRTASMGPRPNLAYEYKGYTPEWGWRMKRSKLEVLDKEGVIVWSKTGRPYRKTYLSKGRVPTNLWTDIPPLSAKAPTLCLS